MLTRYAWIAVALFSALPASGQVDLLVGEKVSHSVGFYRDCRVISDDVALMQARLWLAEACRIGLSNALAILGVRAPDEMVRADDA